MEEVRQKGSGTGVEEGPWEPRVISAERCPCHCAGWAPEEEVLTARLPQPAQRAYSVAAVRCESDGRGARGERGPERVDGGSEARGVWECFFCKGVDPHTLIERRVW